MKTKLMLCTLVLAALPAAAQDEITKKPDRRPIDLVICLDASGSMKTLIDAARQKIWAIVNDLATAKPMPMLRVAVLSYGNQTYDAGAGWVRVDVGLTTDLDKVSEKLFAIACNGGEEYVGRVMQAALARLEWSREKDALKIMVVAGNESADQDKQVSFRDMCKRAIERGIMVNPIYCRRAESVEQEWKEIAMLSDGHYAAIDHVGGTITIDTPFDKRIAELSTALNATYVPYGKEGKRGSANQRAQDDNAGKLNRDAVAERGSAKARMLYVCSWCLVDATRGKQVKLTDIKDEELPKAMRGLTLEQKKAYLDKQFEKRAAIQKQIRELSKQRTGFISKEMVARNLDANKAFDVAVSKAIRKQAESKGFEW
jgi:hypothetical protein